MPPSVLALTSVRTDAPAFQKDLDRLSRKHPDLHAVVDRACDDIRRGPEHWGDAIQGFAHRIWKKRLAVSGHGKRGGLRLVFEVDAASGVAWLLRLYAKNEIADMTGEQIDRARRGIDER